MKRAVVLLSGGINSTTCLSVAVKDGYEVYPISFDRTIKIITPLMHLSKSEIIQLACEKHLLQVVIKTKKRHAVFVTAVF